MSSIIRNKTAIKAALWHELKEWLETEWENSIAYTGTSLYFKEVLDKMNEMEKAKEV